MSNLKAILESKLDSDKISKIGEDNLAKLSEVALDEETVEVLKTSLLSQVEAENSTSIYEKNKDKWHKEINKGILDSFDAKLDLDKDTPPLTKIEIVDTSDAT